MARMGGEEVEDASFNAMPDVQPLDNLGAAKETRPLMSAFMLDAWAGKTEAELKADLRRLNRAAHKWQRIAMCLAVESSTVVEKLPPEWQEALKNAIAAYSD